MRAAGLLCLVVSCKGDRALADCDRVAAVLASFELGNYAEPVQRSPVVAKQRAACIAAGITADEAACLVKASDAWSAAPCAPRLFPAAEPGRCGEVVARIRALIQPNIDQVGSDAKQMIDRMLPAMRASCEQDRWPPAVVDCIIAVPPHDDAAMARCNRLMPKPLQDKLQHRLMDAYQPNASTNAR